MSQGGPHRKFLRPARAMLSWCGEPAGPPGSPGEPTVRGGDPPKRFIVRLAANKGWGDRRGSRRHGEKVVRGSSPPRATKPPAPVECRPHKQQLHTSGHGLYHRA